MNALIPFPTDLSAGLPAGFVHVGDALANVLREIAEAVEARKDDDAGN